MPDPPRAAPPPSPAYAAARAAPLRVDPSTDSPPQEAVVRWAHDSPAQLLHRLIYAEATLRRIADGAREPAALAQAALLEHLWPPL